MKYRGITITNAIKRVCMLRNFRDFINVESFQTAYLISKIMKRVCIEGVLNLWVKLEIVHALNRVYYYFSGWKYMRVADKRKVSRFTIFSNKIINNEFHCIRLADYITYRAPRFSSWHSNIFHSLNFVC